MKFAVLASGSSGNCIVVEAGATTVLVDAGTSCRNLRGLLRRAGADPASVSAICLTHDHTDHVSALATIEKARPVPLYATCGTIEAVCADKPEAADWPWTDIAAGEPFDLGEIRAEPFSVPHDAGDPVGYVFSHRGARLGIATDLGEATAAVRLALRDCDALALEFNHERRMLMESGRPWSLKQRISGRVGHLSNDQAAELVQGLATPRLAALVPLHPSAEGTTTDAACAAARGALMEAGVPVSALVPPVFPTRFVEVGRFSA